MATVISKDEAGARFADLFDRALGGEEIVITQGDEAKLRLMPIRRELEPSGDRSPGSMRGQFTVPDSFFDPMTEEELRDWGF